MKLIIILLFFTQVGFTQTKPNTQEDQFVVIKMPDGKIANMTEEEFEHYQKSIDLLQNPIPDDEQRKIIKKAQEQIALPLEINRPDEFVSHVESISLMPGQPSLPLKVSKGLPVYITFKDVSGNSVNVRHVTFRSDVFSARRLDQINNDEDLSPESTNDLPKNVLLVKANVLNGTGNMPVMTSLSDFPLSFDVAVTDQPGKQYIDRLVVIVHDGSALSQTEDEITLDSREKMMNVVNNIPPSAGSKKISFDFGIVAWQEQDSDMFWIRSPLRVLSPTTSPRSKAALNGINVYHTRETNLITVLDKSNSVLTLRALQ